LNFFVEKPQNELGAVWAREEDTHRFMVARSGDHLTFPFQCDTCWFYNLEKRAPRSSSYSDKRLLGYIRRVNLDGMWARSEATVRSIRLGTIRILASWKELGISPELPALGPWPVGDHVGFRLAIAQLKASQRQGRNEGTHLQYDTIRKLRTAYSHLHESSAEASMNLTNSFRNQLGHAYSNSNSPTQSLFYIRFNKGMLLRMGRQTRQNVALDYKVLHIILNNLDDEWNRLLDGSPRKRWVVIVASYLLISFVLALRGNEGFMVEAGGLIDHKEHGTEPDEVTPYCVIPLLGRFKNEEGERWHLMLAASYTQSGFKVRCWLERLVSILVIERKFAGPAFCHESGKVVRSLEMDAEFHVQLEAVQESNSDLIQSSVIVSEAFSIYRSLRRGSTSRAGELAIPETVVNLHNRWREVEAGGGHVHTRNMRANYTDLRLTRKVRLQYSKAL